MLDHMKFAEDNDVSAELAKKIIDILDAKWLDPAALSSVLWRMESIINKEIQKEKMEWMTEAELNKLINEAVEANISRVSSSSVCRRETPKRAAASFKTGSWFWSVTCSFRVTYVP